MVTAEDVGRVAIFAALDESDRERLARVAADIRLAPGEHAAHEGDERALFAVLEGRIEPVKLVDGIERILGERLVGDILGEVPVTLGTVFPVGFRAAEAPRVLRVEPNDYHAVAAVAPDVAREVGRLSAHRMGGPRGLQGIAAESPPPRALVVGHRWDASCNELRRLLERNQEHVALPRRPARDPAERPCAPPDGGDGRARRSLARGDRRPRRRRRDGPARIRRPLHLHRRGRRDELAPARGRPRPPRLRSHGARARGRGRWPLVARDPYLLESSVPGIFACGDVRSGPVKRVAAAVGEGSTAIAFVHQYLKGIETPVAPSRLSAARSEARGEGAPAA